MVALMAAGSCMQDMLDMIVVVIKVVVVVEVSLKKQIDFL